MSYTALIPFRDGVACAPDDDDEFRNSWGGAAMIWSALCRKYKSIIYPNDTVLCPPFREGMSSWEDLWKADIEMRQWERIALQFTFDNALVRGKDAEGLAAALERFEDAHAIPGQVCHLAAMAKRIRSYQGVDAIGLYASSVGDNQWIGWVNGDDEDDDGDYEHYALTGDRHWWVDIAEVD